MIKSIFFLIAAVGLFADSAAAFSLNRPNVTPMLLSSNTLQPRKNFLQVASAAVMGAWLFPQTSKADVNVGGKIRFGDESIMSPKEHGTSAKPVQADLMYDVNNKLADKVRVMHFGKSQQQQQLLLQSERSFRITPVHMRQLIHFCFPIPLLHSTRSLQICNYNRHFAEMGGYFQSTPFEEQVLQAKAPITFYDSVTGKPLFVAPINRSPEEFVQVRLFLCVRLHGCDAVIEEIGFGMERVRLSLPLCWPFDHHSFSNRNPKFMAGRRFEMKRYVNVVA
jgi:hypothetical protein